MSCNRLTGGSLLSALIGAILLGTGALLYIFVVLYVFMLAFT
jgi:hypothetical protein